MEHIKYPIVVDGRAWREASGFKHEFDEVEVVKRYRLRAGG